MRLVAESNAFQNGSVHKGLPRRWRWMDTLILGERRPGFACRGRLHKLEQAPDRSRASLPPRDHARAGCNVGFGLRNTSTLPAITSASPASAGSVH